MQVRIEFITTCSSTIYGSFETGDIGAFPLEAARHFVEGCRAAKWVDQPAQVAEVDQPAQVAEVDQPAQVAAPVAKKKAKA